MANSSLDIIKQILDSEMQMPENRVWAYNANVDIPKDSKLFIILSLWSSTPYSNNIKYRDTKDGVEEAQSMNVTEDVTISLLSKSTAARDRAHEVLMALNSTFSQSLQEKNHMHISNIGDVNDRSFLEATSRINRFDVECRVFRAYSKIKSVDYYDKFNLEVWTGDSPVSKTKIEINRGESGSASD